MRTHVLAGISKPLPCTPNLTLLNMLTPMRYRSRHDCFSTAFDVSTITTETTLVRTADARQDKNDAKSCRAFPISAPHMCGASRACGAKNADLPRRIRNYPVGQVWILLSIAVQVATTMWAAARRSNWSPKYMPMSEDTKTLVHCVPVS
jgi:hypothetical protein